MSHEVVKEDKCLLLKKLVFHQRMVFRSEMVMYAIKNFEKHALIPNISTFIMVLIQLSLRNYFTF